MCGFMYQKWSFISDRFPTSLYPSNRFPVTVGLISVFSVCPLYFVFCALEQFLISLGLNHCCAVGTVPVHVTFGIKDTAGAGGSDDTASPPSS